MGKEPGVSGQGERGPEAGRRMGAVSDGKSISSPPPEAQLRGI